MAALIFANVGRGGRRAVERDRRREIRHARGQRVRDAAAEAESDTPSLPVQSGRAFSQVAAATKSSVIFVAVHLAEHRRRPFRRRPDSRRPTSARPAQTP